MTRWLIKGEAGAGLSPLDRGLAYGDGLFETLAIIEGRISLWEFHLQRLALGCDRLGLVCPDAGLLFREIQSLAGQDTGVAKIILTRGQGAAGYLADPQQSPTRLLSFRRYPQLPPAREPAPILAITCQTRLAIQPRLAGIKHLNRLEQVLARQEWTDPDIGEGLMLDTEGFLVEGVSSNLFLLEGERLITPLLDRCGVAGTLRRLVMALAPQLGLEVVEERLLPQRALRADALGICNALTGLRPLASLDGTGFEPSLRLMQLAALVWAAAFQ